MAYRVLRSLVRTPGGMVRWSEFHKYLVEEGYDRENAVDPRLYGVRTVTLTPSQHKVTTAFCKGGALTPATHGTKVQWKAEEKWVRHHLE